MIEILETQDDHARLEKWLLSELHRHAKTVEHTFDHVPLALVAEENGARIGGLTGYLLHGWAFVRYLAILPEAQGKGAGRDLLERAEAWTVDHGGIGVCLDTYGFQAPEFYRRQGYVEFGILEGDPPVRGRHYMMKRLDRPRGIQRTAIGGADQ